MENQGASNQRNTNPSYSSNLSNPFGQQQLPNATAVLVLGIISIVGCFCYGFIGLVLGIIALVLSGKAGKLYASNPALYTEASYKNMKAGKVCAIIGTSLSAVYLIILIIYIAIIGAVITGMPWEMLTKH